MLNEKMRIDLEGDWNIHLADGDDNGLQMLGTIKSEGVVGALGYHGLMDSYWKGIRFGERTHWQKLDTIQVMLIMAGRAA